MIFDIEQWDKKNEKWVNIGITSNNNVENIVNSLKKLFNNESFRIVVRVDV